MVRFKVLTGVVILLTINHDQVYFEVLQAMICLHLVPLAVNFVNSFLGTLTISHKFS